MTTATTLAPAVWQSITIGALLPVFTALVTKASARDRVKAAVTALSSVVAAAAAQAPSVAADGFTGHTAAQVGTRGVLAWAAAVLTYQHGWKAFGLARRLAPGRGIGTPTSGTLGYPRNIKVDMSKLAAGGPVAAPGPVLIGEAPMTHVWTAPTLGASGGPVVPPAPPPNTPVAERPTGWPKGAR